MHRILFATLLAATATCAAAERPNIVLILADDLGYGDVGCFNPASKIPTPHIDRLAEQGTRFTDAHAPASVCVPTRYSLLTGRYSFRRPSRNGAFDAGPLIDEDVFTLPAMLAQAGYRTEMIGKWHLGFRFDGWDAPLRGGPVDRGFDSYFGVPASTDIPPFFFIEGDRVVAAPTERIDEHHSDRVRPIQGAFWRAGGIAPGLELEQVLPTFASRALATLDARAESPAKPFFLYIALTAPHTPWLPTTREHARFQGNEIPPALHDYAGFVAQVDDVVGQITARLDERGLADDTIVLFTSDNGPTWYDEDVERTSHDSSGGLRGMKGDAWEAGHRVPFVVRWPGRVPAGRASDDLVGQIDLFATFASLIGHDLDANAAPDSENLLPLLFGKPNATGRETLITQSSMGVLALRNGHWKFIPHLGSAGFSEPKREQPRPGEPAVQLYDLAADPSESNNLARAEGRRVEDLTALLERLRTSNATAHRLSD